MGIALDNWSGRHESLDPRVFFLAPIESLINGDPRSGETEMSLAQLERDHKVIITCIDYRERTRDGYLLTSAGNIPHENLIDDLHLILSGKKALVLRCHTDCAKSKAELGRQENESDESYAERVELHTLRRLWRDAQVLLRDPSVDAAVRDGLFFCIARLDSDTGMVTYYRAVSDELVKETTGTFQSIKAPASRPGLSSLVENLRIIGNGRGDSFPEGVR